MICFDVMCPSLIFIFFIKYVVTKFKFTYPQEICQLTLTVYKTPWLSCMVILYNRAMTLSFVSGMLSPFHIFVCPLRFVCKDNTFYWPRWSMFLAILFVLPSGRITPRPRRHSTHFVQEEWWHDRNTSVCCSFRMPGEDMFE